MYLNTFFYKIKFKDFKIFLLTSITNSVLPHVIGVTLKCMLLTGYFSGTHCATVGTHFDNDFGWQRTYGFL